MRRVDFLACAMAIAAMVSLVGGLPADAAPPEGKGKPHKEHKQEGSNKPRKAERPDHSGSNLSRANTTKLVSASIGFQEARRIAVANHYTGYGALSPGIRKNLARGKPLPPGIAKKAVPAAMLAELPVYPGYEWRVYGSDLVLVPAATSAIAEVLMDVFQ